METNSRRKATRLKPSYKPFEKTLIDKNKKKVDVKRDLGISPSTLHKMKHGEYIALDIIALLCEYLDCEINEIVEFVKVDQ